jgi:hypothetical protein
MTKEEIKFLIDNKINFESVKMGYTRNISFDVLGEYEQLYRKYLDSQFVLTYWCGACVFDMMERLIRFCEEQEEYMNVQTYEPTKVEAKKRGRPKK